MYAQCTTTNRQTIRWNRLNNVQWTHSDIYFYFIFPVRRFIAFRRSFFVVVESLSFPLIWGFCLRSISGEPMCTMYLMDRSYGIVIDRFPLNISDVFQMQKPVARVLVRQFVVFAFFSRWNLSFFSSATRNVLRKRMFSIYTIYIHTYTRSTPPHVDYGPTVGSSVFICVASPLRLWTKFRWKNVASE